MEDRVLHPGYDYLETAISMETGLHFSVIKILICLEKPNCVVLAEHGILLNQSVKVSIPLSRCLVKKKKKRKKKRRILINMPNPFQIHPNPLFFNFAVFFSLQLLFINLSLLQSLIKLVSDNFIRDKEEAKKQNELKMSIQTRIMRGLKLAIQAFNPIMSPFKC